MDAPHEEDIEELGSLPGLSSGDLGPVRRRAFVLSPILPVRGGGGEEPAPEPMHWQGPPPWEGDAHQEFEFGIVLSGSQERISGLAERADSGRIDRERLEAGDVWLCAMWEPHWWRDVAPGTSDLFIQFTAEYLHAERVGRCFWFELFAPVPEHRPRAGCPALQEAMLSLGHRMGQELANRREGWEWAVRFDLLRAMVELARSWEPPGRSAPRPSHRTTRGADMHRILPALERVNSQLPSRVSLREAADACGMSRGFFCSVFRRSVGVSFSRFGLRARLAWVSGQLRSSDEPIAAIAASAGFTDESHVCRTFLRYHGCTPGAYRRA